VHFDAKTGRLVAGGEGDAAIVVAEAFANEVNGLVARADLVFLEQSSRSA